MKPKILILHTGGTLGMKPREPDQALAPDEFGSTVLEQVPDLAKLADIDARVLYNLDSSDLTPDHWLELAGEVASAVGKYQGCVVTHGTDAMAYTASALSYVLKNLPIPVILTGSQRPLADVRSDARANLVGAVDLACRDIPEVSIYFGGKLFRGNRARKSSSFAFGAYDSPNFPVLAEVGAGVRLVTEPIRPEGDFAVVGRFDRRVVALQVLPGQQGGVLQMCHETGTRGLLLQAFGVGNIPAKDPGAAEAISELVARGVVVAIGSQAQHGQVDLDVYPGGRAARDAGAVGTGDMNFEAAAVKLMYLLGTFEDPAEVRRCFTLPIAGEMGTGD